LADFHGGAWHHFIATTVDLLTTGVDVPWVRNIAFFKYVRSPIAFYQMIGRGTRIDTPSGRLLFRVYDYTNATRLFGQDFVTRPAKLRGEGPGPEQPKPPEPWEPTIVVKRFEVLVPLAGQSIVTQVDGRAMAVPIEEYKQRLAARLVAEAPSLDAFRLRWIDPQGRRSLIDTLVASGYSPSVVRMVDGIEDFDLFDVLAELGYGMAPRTRDERADAFSYKQRGWLSGLPQRTAATVEALAAQFSRGGTEGLENPHIFQTPEVVAAGGLGALKQASNPTDLLPETKRRMFAA
jgi:type I restriction enzyme R subunit